ncbi:hypothetical protein ASA1KI_07300 [Opitutales bacterium ASA1]|nr:hypothetical protein ASA1KI_07300 [Opitutales bacterium ASA1]
MLPRAHYINSTFELILECAQGFSILAASAIVCAAEASLEFAIADKMVVLVGGEAIEGFAVLENTGDDDVNVRGIVTSCGCLSIPKEPFTIQAGDQELLPYSVRPPNAPGVTQQFVTLEPVMHL